MLLINIGCFEDQVVHGHGRCNVFGYGSQCCGAMHGNFGTEGGSLV